MNEIDPSVPSRLRLDMWLDVACLFKTRSEAQKACKGGKVDVNGQRAKPHRDVGAGDEVAITRTLGRKQRVVVRGLVDRHVPKAQARELYLDVTPPPSPQEVELLRLVRLADPLAMRGGRRRSPAPGRRERRAWRRLKELDE